MRIYTVQPIFSPFYALSPSHPTEHSATGQLAAITAHFDHFPDIRKMIREG